MQTAAAAAEMYKKMLMLNVRLTQNLSWMTWTSLAVVVV